MPDFYSQSSNFTSAVAGGVDPRTGLFSASIPLGTLSGNNGLGPSLGLTWAYGPLTDENAGFGIGCSLPLTSYDTSTGTLSLANGERYKVIETSGGVILNQRKLKNLRFERLADAYRVIYPTGDIEVLTGPDNTSPIKVVTALYTPVGHRMTLTWDFDQYVDPRLMSIADETNTLLQVSYESAMTTLTFWPDKTESYSVRQYFLNGYVTSVENEAIDPPLTWSFSYGEVGSFWMLTQIDDPVKLRDTVEYKAEGHRFPDSVDLPPLPYVTQRTLRPGASQPAIKTTYSYSDYNYLGGGTNSAWDSSEDYLYSWLTDYEYTSTEVLVHGTKKISTVRRYNKFHLLIDEDVQFGSCAKKTSTKYHARAGAVFAKQPAQFLSPKQVTVVYRNGKSVGTADTTKTEFDEYGNPTSITKPDGTVTTYEYYPAAGEGEDCPAEPNGFVRLVKSKTLTPAQDDYGDTPSFTTRYRYRAMTGVTGSAVTSAVVPDTDELLSGDQQFSGVQYTYVDDPDSAEHGRLKTTTATLKGAGEPAAEYSTTFEETYTVASDQLTKTTTFTGHDALSFTQSETRSLFSGRMSSVVDEQGNVMSYANDGLGRVASQTLNAGTEYERTSTWVYQLNDESGSQVQMTDPAGNMTMDVFDALGRKIQHQVWDADADTPAWFLVSETTYDALGREVTTTTHDKLRDTGLGEKNISDTRTFKYDIWNQPSTTAFADGHEAISTFNPVYRIRTNQIKGVTQKLAVEEIRYNRRGLAYSQTRKDANGVILGTNKYQYDGLGRLRSMVDLLGRTTAYSYDVWGRVVTTTAPDGTVVTKSYAPASSAELTAEVLINEKSIGTQQFDSLNRVTQSSSGGRTFKYHYTDASPEPAKVTTPAAQAIAYKYNEKLDNVVAKVTSENISRSFGYDAKSAAVTKGAVSDGMESGLAYYKSGLLKEERFKSGKDTKVANYIWSVSGLIQTYTDVTGVKQQWEYDEHGRPVKLTDPQFSVALTLDEMGRVTGWTTTDASDLSTLSTTLKFDVLGREIKRTISGTSTKLVISQEYYKNDQASRRLTKQGKKTLRDEKYIYNKRNQLYDYQCSGSALPKCEYGLPITRRVFNYDGYGNITRVVTTFENATQDTATYVYGNSKDPMQLTAVKHTHKKYPKKIELAYNKVGALTTDEAGRTLQYDELGRLTGVKVDKAEAASYRYDAFDTLVGQTVGKADVEKYYRAGSLVNEIRNAGKSKKRYVRVDDACVAQRTESSDGSAENQLVATDMAGSVLEAQQGKARQAYAYTPYGYKEPDGEKPVDLGYNGEQQDSVTGAYHLGNGYRAYNPVLMRFNAPDSMSPFGAGGPNAYAYCDADPINARDPSGHLSAQAITGITLGVAGLAFAAYTILTVVTGGAALALVPGILLALDVVSSVTAILSGALEQAAPEASGILGWVSLGTGLLAFGGGIAAAKAARAGASAAKAKIMLKPDAAAIAQGEATVVGDFLVYHGGRELGQAQKLLVYSHGGGAPGLAKAPTAVKFYASAGRGVSFRSGPMHGVTGVIMGQYKPAQTVAKGVFSNNYELRAATDKYFDISRAALARQFEIDIATPLAGGGGLPGLGPTLRDLFSALKSKGLKYEQGIEALFCRPSAFRSIARRLDLPRGEFFLDDLSTRVVPAWGR